ncbi:MAG: mechanosensitive ion channel family protein [Saprospiraceae bacterium]|nr:mechanosensitive ion channel family protein [Saprospiraceae bacterium]
MFRKKIAMLALWALCASVSAQTDTIKKLDETLLLIKKSDSLRIIDSFQRLALQNQLGELQNYEVTKRKELEKQLLELKQKDSLNRVFMANEIDSLKKIVTGYPVAPYEDTIFYVYTKIGKIEPEERAELITKRLQYLYKHFSLKTDSLNIIDYGQTVDVVYKEKILISVTEYDEMWYGKPKTDIANEYKKIITNDLNVFKKNISTLTVLKQIGSAALIIAIQIILIVLVNIFFKRKVDKYIVEQKGKAIKGIKIRDYHFLDAEKGVKAVLGFSKLLRGFVILLQLYITIPMLFSIFPPTQRLAETLFGYIFEPAKQIWLAFVNYLPNLFAIIVIVFITRYVVRFLHYLSREIEHGKLKLAGFYPDWAKPTFNIVRFLIYTFMFIVIFPYLPGSDSPVFQGVSVFLGIVFSLGSSSVVGNVVAGLVMTYMRPFQLGDRIKVGDIMGDVVEKTPFVTRIKTTKNEFITIPNSNILSSNVINYNTSKKTDGIILYTTVTIGYDVPWKKMHQALIDAALRTDLILKEPLPFVLQTSLDDFYVSYQLNAYSMEPNRQAYIYSLLHQNIQDVCNERGIEIMSPHYRAHRDGNATTIPQQYLQDDQASPA